MLSVWDTNFLVIDVETTGYSPILHSLIDIACVTTIGGVAVDKFSSLINPHQFIPEIIQKLTHITNEMVYNAPETIDVLRLFSNILNTKDSVFVAHNAAFDYPFIKGAYARCELEFPDMKKLCTLKLARRLLRKDLKKNVGSLAEYFGITVKNRHRALGDADATSQILCRLIEIAEDEHGIVECEELLEFQNRAIKNFLPANTTKKRLENKLAQLPACPGVYYFKNRTGEVHYVGKAKSLVERVNSYFSFGNITSRKISAMLRKTYDLEFQCKNSELEALIAESREIKSLLPYYNTMEKAIYTYSFIKLDVMNEFPTTEAVTEITDDDAEYYGPFRSSVLVQQILDTINKHYMLRKCETAHITPDKTKKPCFYYHIKQCHAPCCGGISSIAYNSDVVDKVRYFLSGTGSNIITQLERQMHDFAEELEFEKAAIIKQQIIDLKKVFEKDAAYPVSVSSDNFAMILPVSAREKVVQILLIRAGKLETQFTIGRKAPLEKLFASIDELYYASPDVQISTYNKIDFNDMKIINSWIYNNKDAAKFVYFKDKSQEEFRDAIESIVRSFEFPEDEAKEIDNI